MHNQLKALEFKLRMEEYHLEDYKEMYKDNKKTARLGLIAGGIFSILLILIYELGDSEITMLNVLTTSFFVCSAYTLVLDSSKRRTDYHFKIMKSEMEINVLKEQIKFLKLDLGLQGGEEDEDTEQQD